MYAVTGVCGFQVVGSKRSPSKILTDGYSTYGTVCHGLRAKPNVRKRFLVAGAS
jgi:hypothetical protein